MIIFQIVTGLLLIPLTVLLLFIFNIYLKSWIYWAAISAFTLFYAVLFGLTFHSTAAAASVFILLAIFYTIRMNSLKQRLRSKNSSRRSPFVRAEIKTKKYPFHAILYFPLSFLKIFKLLPDCLSRELIKKTHLEIGISTLVDQILDASIETKIEITCREVDLFFEIQ